MTEDHDPGWWRASDGAWYPPERHHDPEHRAHFAAGADPSAHEPAPATPSWGSVAPPPPTPPGPGRSIVPKSPAPRRGPGTVVTVIVALLVVVAVGAGSYLLAGGGGDDDEPGGGGESSTTTTGGGGEVVEATVDDLRFALPAGWITAVPGAGETGEERFPDDQPLAGAFNASLELAETQGAVLFGLDTDLTSQSTLTVLRFEGVPLDEVSDGARVSLNADPEVSIDVDRSLALTEGEGYLLRYRFPGGTGEAIGVQLIVPDGDDTYALVFSAADDATADDLLAIADSITVG